MQSWAMFLPALPRRLFRFLDSALRAPLEMTGGCCGARNDDRETLRSEWWQRNISLEMTGGCCGRGRIKKRMTLNDKPSIFGGSHHSHPLFCTQSRDRTGTDCSTGVWDQRVYRFRHLGLSVQTFVNAQLRLAAVLNFCKDIDKMWFLQKKC